MYDVYEIFFLLDARFTDASMKMSLKKKMLWKRGVTLSGSNSEKLS